MAAGAAISASGLKALGWTLCAVGMVLTIMRFTIRISLLHKLLADDVFHFLALACFIAMLAIYQYLLPDLDFFAAADTGQVHLSPAALTQLWHDERALQLAGLIVETTGIWMVKASYLALYYTVFSISRKFKIAWWTSATIVFLSWWASVFGLIAGCGSASDWFNYQKCYSPDTAYYFLYVLTSWTGALSVVTDLIVIALPLSMLRSLHTSRAQRISLGITFGLALIVVAFDITRTVVSIETDDFTISTAFQYLVIGLAVIISALPPMRAVLNPQRRRELTTSLRPLFSFGGSGTRRSAGDSGADERGAAMEMRDRSESGSNLVDDSRSTPSSGNEAKEAVIQERPGTG